MPQKLALDLIAVDIGNSRLKIGQFDSASDDLSGTSLPEPGATLELSLEHRLGNFDSSQLTAWCDEHVGAGAKWRVASVHRGAAEQFAAAIQAAAASRSADWPMRKLTYRDVPLTVTVESPDRVGIDRLVGAFAA